MRLGILGTGTVALDHARAGVLAGATVAAGCARSPGSERWLAFKAAFPQADFRPAGALLSDPDIDAIVACPSWWAMDELLPSLMACGKPVLMEKPIAVTASAVEAALALGGGADDKLVGFCRRYYEPVVRLRRRVSQGGLVSAEVRVSENLANLVRRWGRDILPHVLAYSSCHVLDLALHLLGPLRPERVFRRAVAGYEPFHAVNAVLSTAAGQPVFLSINPDDPCVVGVTCRFDDGTLWTLGPIERLTVYRGYDVIEPSADFNVRRYTPHAAEAVTVDTSFRPGFLEQMRAFVAGAFGPGARPRESLALLRLIAALETAE